MNSREKACEFFDTVIMRKKFLVEIPRNCSQGEVGALLHLTFVEDGITSSKLATNLNVSLPRVVSLLNSLEGKKLIKKITDEKDKRKTVIYITDIGRKLVLNKKKEAIDTITKIIERLDEEDINQYIRLVNKIGNIMEEIQD